MKYRILIGIAGVLLAVLISGCVQQPQAEVRKEGAGDLLKQVIKVKIEGKILHYQEESSWKAEKFSEILESKEVFKSKQIKQFKE
jgi:hypothetical protein